MGKTSAPAVGLHHFRRGPPRAASRRSDPQYEEQGAPRELQKGKRYRLAFDNHTDDAHPVHLHRNTFELTSVHGFHCHQQLHGFKMLFQWFEAPGIRRSAKNLTRGACYPSFIFK